MEEFENKNLPEEDVEISISTDAAMPATGDPIGTTPKKPKKKLSKKKIVLIVVASVMAAILIAVSGVLIWLFAGGKDPVILDGAELNVYMENDFSIGLSNYSGDGTGKTYALDNWFGAGKAYSVSDNDGVVSLAGSVLTVNKAGTFKLTVDSTVKNVTVYDAVNVSTFAEFVKATKEGKAMVLQADITFDKTKLPAGETGADLTIKANVYGNGHRVYTQGYTGTESNFFTSVLIVKGPEIVIRDLQVYGKTPAADMDLLLMDMYGILFWVVTDAGQEKRTDVQFINCILENANRHIYANNADVTVKGTIIRNAADACISIENNNNGPTNVTVENSVLSNSSVTAINSWGDKATNDGNFATITLKGFVDIYNWRDTKQTQIVPRAMGSFISNGANNIINSELNSGNYNDMFYGYNGKNYLHFAILCMATGGSGGNKTVVLDYTDLGYKKQSMPLPPAANMFIKMCDIYGYDVDGDPLIKPDNKIADNQKIYQELRNGRAA